MNALEQLIPIGYKTSEIGIIPERWNAVQAKEVVEFFGGYGFSSRLVSNDGTKWLKIANVGINEIKWDAVSYLPDYLLKSFKDYSLAECDVVMALTRPLLGDQLKVAKIENKDLPALLNQRVAKLKPKSNTNLNYIYYSIQREDFIAAMNLAMAGTDPPNIGTNALGKIFVALPENDKEQAAIANVLSDVDALLTELEELIAKKQAIKTATMQQLLTGKTRLPQFATYTEGEKKGQQKGTKPSELGDIPEDWDVSPLGDLVSIQSGESPSKFQFKSDGIPYFKVEQLNNGLVYAEETEYRVDTKKVVDAGSIIFPKRGASILLNKIRVLKNDSFMDTNLMTLTCSDKLNNLFLHNILTYKGLDQVADTTSIPQINNKHIIPFLIAAPNIEEQTAIATILSDMDNEIQTLEQRLAKTRQIKQGMMQALLTGRIRLPFNQAKGI